MTTAQDRGSHRGAAQQASLADVGVIASRIVHEIRNPLNAIRMQVAVIRKKLTHPDGANIEAAQEQLASLEAEVARLESLAQAFLDYGKPPADNPEEIDVPALVEEVAELLEAELKKDGVTFELSLPPSEDGGCRTRMDRRKLCQVIHNLAANARDAMGGAGTLTLSVASPAGNRGARLAVADTGKGIPAEELGRIFEPFHSTSGGSGLGLPIVSQIIDSAGGSIHVRSTPGKGTRFDIDLPPLEAIERG